MHSSTQTLNGSCGLRRFRYVLPDYGKVLARGTAAPRVRKGWVIVRIERERCALVVARCEWLRFSSRAQHLVTPGVGVGGLFWAPLRAPLRAVSRCSPAVCCVDVF